MGIVEELYILSGAVWAGCVVCIVHEVLCLIRKIIKHRDWVVELEDFLFWIFTSIFIFEQVFYSNNGIWRWYFFIGVVGGVWAIHTIWYAIGKVVIKVRKFLKTKQKHRMINK